MTRTSEKSGDLVVNVDFGKGDSKTVKTEALSEEKSNTNPAEDVVVVTEQFLTDGLAKMKVLELRRILKPIK